MLHTMRYAQLHRMADTDAYVWSSTGTFVLDLGCKRRFGTIVLQEFLDEGQRVAAFTLEIPEKGGWKEIARGTTMGHKRILQFPKVRAKKIRLSVTDSRATPLIKKVQVFKK